MQNNQPPRPEVWIAGGDGFVGHAITRVLKSQGYRVYLLSRKPIDTQGDFRTIQTDYSVDNLNTHFSQGNCVINLIGILNEKGFDGSGFHQAHVQLTQNICQACENNDVTHYLHMSALNANTRGPSHYLISKAKAEDVVRQASLNFTIFRPSVIFGPGDSFTNRFAQLLRLSPYYFPLACPRSRFQPIFVDDVAQCFVQSLTVPECINQTYDLCGPDQFTLKEIVELIASTLNKKRRIIPLSDSIAKLQARILQLMPGKPFTMDNYLSLQINSICTGDCTAPFELNKAKLNDEIGKYLVQ